MVGAEPDVDVEDEEEEDEDDGGAVVGSGIDDVAGSGILPLVAETPRFIICTLWPDAEGPASA